MKKEEIILTHMKCWQILPHWKSDHKN